MFNLNEEKPPKTERPQRAPSDKIDVSLLVIVGILVVAIAFTFLVDFIFSPEIDLREVSANTAIVSACTIAIYILLRSYAMRKGRRTEEWKNARVRLSSNDREITAKGYAQDVTQYCREWEERVLESDIESILSRVGVPVADYLSKYRGHSRDELKTYFPDLTEAQADAILRAGRVRRLHYNEAYIRTGEKQRRHRAPSDGVSARTVNALVIVRIFFTAIATALFSASILQDVILNFSAEAVVRCVVKLAVIAFFGALGMVGGYNHAAVREVDEMTARADEQERFLKWCENMKNY